MTRQNGQPVAIFSAPVPSASSMRSRLIRLPIFSSIHIRAPPAPQQNERSACRGISVRRHAGRADELARRGVDLVVPAQVARVVVGDVAARRPAARPGSAGPPGPAVQQLGVVDDLVVPAQLRVLVGQGVEAVRAGRDDLAGAGSRPSKPSLSVSTFCCASIWNTNSLPDRRAGSPVQVSPGRARRTPTPARVQQLGDRARGLLAPGPRTRRRSRPRTGTRVSGVQLAVDDRHLEVAGPSSSPAGCGRSAPTGCPCSPGSGTARPSSEGNADSISTW